MRHNEGHTATHCRRHASNDFFPLLPGEKIHFARHGRRQKTTDAFAEPGRNQVHQTITIHHPGIRERRLQDGDNAARKRVGHRWNWDSVDDANLFIWKFPQTY